MLTRLRNKNRTVAFVAMWLIAMATIFVVPGSCAMVTGCGTAKAAVIRPVAEAADAPSCHTPAPKTAGEAHCGMGGPCCQPPASSTTADGAGTPTNTPSDTPSGVPSGHQHGACVSEAPQHADTALSSVSVPTLDLAAVLIPVPAPWIYLATNTIPHTSAPLLPPRDAVTRPQGSRAPPASLA